MQGSFKNVLLLLVSQIIAQARNVLQHLNDYITYCEKEKIGQSQRAILFTYNQLKSTLLLLKDIQNTLEHERCNTKTLMQAEIEIRVAIQSIAALHLYLSWRSPVYSQAILPQFFNLYDQETKRVLYERWSHKEVNRIETQLLKVFGLSNEQFSCTVVNSGMAAICLVESFLIRNLLKPGDSILLSPHIYFESNDLLKSLNWLNVIEAESYDYKYLIDTIENNNIKAVFINTLTNTSEQRMVDIEFLLDHFKKHKNCPAFVIDGTMLPCAINLSYIASFKKKENVFYIESCSKYLQLGLDMSIAGVLVYDAKLKTKFNTLRRYMGLILTEHNSHLFPVYKQKQLMNRISRIESNAGKIAYDLSIDPEIMQIYEVIYPGLNTHPDYLLAKRIKRYGGCVVFKFKITEDTDLAKKPQILIDIIINNAKLYKIPIAYGLSFGFSFPRICLEINAVPTEDKRMRNVYFLRLYVGDQGSLNAAIIKLLKISFKQHAVEFCQNKEEEVVHGEQG